MKRSLRTFLTAVVALAATVAVAACGSSSSGSSGTDGGTGSEGGGAVSLTIGQLVPLTGGLADFGPSMAASGKLAGEQINAALEQDGMEGSVTIKTADTQGEPAAAVQAARQLGAEGAQCFAGPASSEEAVPVARAVALREEIPMVASVATATELTELSDEGFVSRIMIGDQYQGQALVEAMEKFTLEGSAEGKVVSVAARNDSYGTGVDEYFMEAWEAAGGTIGANVLFDPEQANYNSEAAQMVADHPDVFLYIGYPKEYLRFGPALARTGAWSPADTWGVSLLSENLPKEAGLATTEGLSDAGQGTPKGSDTFKEFTKIYQEAGGPPSQAFDAHQFDAVMTCYLAAVAAGSTDGPAIASEISKVTSPPGKKVSFPQLPEALKLLEEGKEIDYQGASGPIDLNESGDPTQGVFNVYTIKNGDYLPRGEILVSGSKIAK